MKIRKEKTSTKFHRADHSALFHPTQKMKPASATCVTFYLQILIYYLFLNIYRLFTQMDQMNPNNFKPSRFQAHLADKNTNVLNLGWGG